MKLFNVLLLTLVLILGMTTLANAQDISVIINGLPQAFDPAPVNIDGRILVPMRAFFEALGADVTWDNETRTAIGRHNGIEIRIPIDSTEPTINGIINTIDVPAKIIDGSTFVPARFIGEALDGDVDWDDETKTVIVTGKDGKEIATEYSTPVACLYVQSPEQFLVMFHISLATDAEPVFILKNVPSVEGGKHWIELSQDNGGLKVEEAFEQIINRDYLIELTEDWTMIYDAAVTGINYWDDSVNSYELIISNIIDDEGNIREEIIRFSLGRDVTAPTVYAVEEIYGFSYIAGIDDPLNQVWLACTSEPVQIPNALNPTDPLTPSAAQLADGGIPGAEVKFSKGNTNIDGEIPFVYEDDRSFRIQPVKPLAEGEWTVTIKNLADDVGNVNPIQEFKVQIYPN